MTDKSPLRVGLAGLGNRKDVRNAVEAASRAASWGAATAHNRVLDLVALVLIRLSPLHQLERPAPKGRHRVSAEVLRTHEGIAAAIVSGDQELARHRMRRHLQTVGPMS